MSVTVPLDNQYEPKSAASQPGTNAVQDLSKGCPFYSPDEPICCLADNLAIIVANYESLDAVFNADSSVCAVNLKMMWCKYACDPMDAYFSKCYPD